jgi:nicotinate phosphoribosyltransferase
LDERELDEIHRSGAPIDGFGIGTRLDVSADAPYLDCAYKIQQYAGKPRRKKSEGKATWPGPKQVFRGYQDGRMSGDVIARADEQRSGQPLLEPVMSRGERIEPRLPSVDLRERISRQLCQLPPALKSLDPRAEDYGVEISASLRELADKMDRIGGGAE